MTTLAYKEGVLAADRLATSGAVRTGKMTKIACAGNYLFAGAGKVSEIIAFRKWVERGMPATHKFEFKSSFVWLINAKGRLALYSSSFEPIYYEDNAFDASGTGREFAMGAMAAGADARSAVEIAQQFDIYSGGGVDVLTLDDLKTHIAALKAKKEKKQKV